MPSLQVVPIEPNLKLAEMLEDLAKEARAGNLIGVAMLLNYTAHTGSTHAGHWRRMDALYAFEMWKHRLIHGDQPGL